MMQENKILFRKFLTSSLGRNPAWVFQFPFPASVQPHLQLDLQRLTLTRSDTISMYDIHFTDHVHTRLSDFRQKSFHQQLFRVKIFNFYENQIYIANTNWF